MNNSSDNTGENQDKPLTYKTIRFYVIMIGLLVLTKVYIADIYAIPSGSMEQTLHGREHSGDRIFCTKFSYWFDTPKRWDVFVFKYPYMQSILKDRSPYKGENFIKRCVGLPNEDISFNRGDVYVATKTQPRAKCLVKPDSIQRNIWLPVYSENFEDLSIEELGQYWKLKGWSIENDSLVASANPASMSFVAQNRFGALAGIPDRYVRRQYVEFKCPEPDCGGRLRKTIRNPKITARCPRCGKYLTEKDVVYYDDKCSYPTRYQNALMDVATLNNPKLRDSHWHYVPDLRVLADVSFAQNGASYEVQIFDDLYLCSAKIRAGSNEVEISINGKLKTTLTCPLIEVGSHSIEFYRLDRVLRLFIDDKLCGEVAIDSGYFNAEPEPNTANIDIIASAGISIDNLKIDRDIYYFNSPMSPYYTGTHYPVGANEFMALGDNSPASNDSRNWGNVPQKNLVGKAQAVWWSLESIRLIK